MYINLKFSSLMCFLLFVYIVSISMLLFLVLSENLCLLIDWVIVKGSSCSVSMSLILDSISLVFSFTVCLISMCVMLFSSSYMSHDIYMKRFIYIVMLFVLSMNFLIFIPNLLVLLLGWDGLGIVSFALVIYYQNMKSLSAGMLTILMNRIGDVMILFSIGLMFLQGSWFINLMMDFYLSSYLVIIILIAGMTKSAQIPFSAWLPAAMAAPTPVSALVHSSTLVTAGIYLLIRFYPFLSLFKNFYYILFFISILTLLLSGIGANYENDLKKIIALSTLSQLGYMMLSLSIGSLYFSLYHLYTHALFKALLFLCAGAVIHMNNNNQDIRKMGMIFYQMPFTIICMNIANLSLCGIPFLSGFYSKDLILEMMLSGHNNFFFLVLVFFSVGLTVSYSFRLSMSMMWGAAKMVSLHSKKDNDFYINIPTFILGVFSVLGGQLYQGFIINFCLVSLCLPAEMKFFTFFMILMGGLSGLFLWSDYLKLNKKSKMKWFLSTMWFLSHLSSQPVNKFSLNWAMTAMKVIDYGWLELMGGQGAMYFTRNTSSLNSWIQLKMLSILVLSSFLVMSLLLIF